MDMGEVRRSNIWNYPCCWAKISMPLLALLFNSQALDTNKEMVTVGTSNLLSGLMFGFTGKVIGELNKLMCNTIFCSHIHLDAIGSYIFSQTIFTYRTGCHSRWVAIFIMVAYLGVCASTVNILQIAPLFFLGATLIFIGYDLLWEWLIEIRSKIFMMEYIVLLITFVAIQVIGMDFGILFGVVIALVDHVASTTRVSSLSRVMKRSRAVWAPEDWNVLQLHGYHGDHAKIVTLEIKGSVFFGSSQKLLTVRYLVLRMSL
jgi:MFS superfamily sulfate permease-like transporter